GPDALVAQALVRRADLRAAGHQGEGARILARAAGDELRPRLDLTVGVGYTGAEPGRDWSRLVTPFYRTLSGWTATVEVAWQAAAANALARGDAEQARAASRLAEVELADLRRRIRAGVVVAAEAIRHGRLELEKSEAAVRLYRTAVENEERKFGLGMSTLFDILQAEDALTSALQSQIAARARYATALARLAYETGTLVEVGEEVLSPE
ncbi:MAG TPA: TolC family protein, partial [Longimicrobium sp.]|nr:TolC family protein [Longimicrobium sp.]